MVCESVLFIKNLFPYLWGFCEVVSSSNMRKNEVQGFVCLTPIMVVDIKIWIFFLQVIAKYLHFVMSL